MVPVVTKWRLAAAVAVLLPLLASCRATGPATFYVIPDTADWFVHVDGDDGNSGRSFEEAFASIDRASRSARPGDVVLVGPGTYAGPVKTTARGRRDERVTFMSSTPLGAKIDGTGSFAAWTNDGDYVDIVGFEVTGSDYQGIINYGSFVYILNNWVHHLAVPTCNRPNGGAGINQTRYDAEGNRTIGNVVNHVLAPPECTGLVHGIYHANVGGLVQNNIVFDVTFAGIQTWHAANAVTVTNNLVWNAVVGIIVGAADQRAEGYVVANNIVMNTQRGIEESGRNFGSNRYESNLMYANEVDFVMVTGKPEGTIREQPRHVRFAKDGSGDYRLRGDSPAIDAGTREGAPTFDFEGILRPQGAAVDIGPFEHCQTACAQFQDD